MLARRIWSWNSCGPKEFPTACPWSYQILSTHRLFSGIRLPCLLAWAVQTHKPGVVIAHRRHSYPTLRQMESQGCSSSIRRPCERYPEPQEHRSTGMRQSYQVVKFSYGKKGPGRYLGVPAEDVSTEQRVEFGVMGRWPRATAATFRVHGSSIINMNCPITCICAYLTIVSLLDLASFLLSASLQAIVQVPCPGHSLLLTHGTFEMRKLLHEPSQRIRQFRSQLGLHETVV